ncbi:MAG: type IV pilus assembly protein PilM [Gaiellaceae bacterium]
MSVWKQEIHLPRLRRERGERPEPFWRRELRGPRRQKADPVDHVRAAADAMLRQADARVEWALAALEAEIVVPEPEPEPGPGPEPEPEVEPAAAPARAPQAQARVPRRGQGRGNVVGLKIGAAQIAAARVATNGSIDLLQLAREPLEPGIVVAGEARDTDALAEALKAFFRKHKLPTRSIRLGIASNRIGVRIFELEGTADVKQLENAVRFRAQEELPIPVDQAVLDYRVLDESVEEDGRTTRRILLVVTYRDLIDKYVEACRKADLRLTGIDLEAFALLRAVAPPPADDDEEGGSAAVAVAVGEDRSTLAISAGRVCEFTRVLEWGTANVDAALAASLGLPQGALSLSGAEIPDGATELQAAAAREAMRQQVSTFARELVASLQFYQSQSGSLGIAGITLTGGSAHLQSLQEELRRLIGVPVEIGDPLARVRVSEDVEIDETTIGAFAIAIGLGIED